MSEGGCRSCSSDELELILSLGRTPLANALVSEEDLSHPEETYPLDLVFCPACTLVQITETVSPEKLFRNYLYFTSFSDTMMAHAEALAARLIDELGLNGTSLVVEIASNDGYLLQNYQRAGIRVLGVEPAVNVAEVARERGIPTISEFFGAELAETLGEQGDRADLVHAHNVLAHVPDLNGFVRGIALLLKRDGAAVIEVPYVKDMIDRIEFDTIYHEHLCYFSLTALDRLFCRHDLVLADARRVSIHGGSLQLLVRPAAAASSSAAVEQLLAEERAWGVENAEGYAAFAKKVEELGHSLRELLGDLKDNGKRIAAYGAAAKGSTLLNAFEIDSRIIDFVVDRSTYKQGLYVPGVRLPISAPERLLDEQPDYALLLTWNFADEILSQQAEYRSRGGKFIIPLPEPRVV
jgi:SAM-dependent methyltransferase